MKTFKNVLKGEFKNLVDKVAWLFPEKGKENDPL